MIDAPIKNITDEWISEALGTIQALATRPEGFSGNEIWDAGLSDPGNRRVLGILVVRARNAGLLAEVGSAVSLGGHGQRISRWIGAGDWAAEVAA